MSPLTRALLAGTVLNSQALASSRGCDDGACEAVDSSSLLSINRDLAHRSLQHAAGGGHGKCPVSGVACSATGCCPGVKFTLDKTFPCPTAAADFHGCEVNSEQEIVDGLLEKMTRAEKYRMLRGVGWKEGSWDTMPGYYIGNSGAGLQEEYGIPNLNMQDNGQGFRTVTEDIIDQVTGWPVTLAISSSWSEADTERWAVALGQEFRKKGANVILGPGVNVHRVARGGRNAEYNSGESPYLGARLTPPYVRGVQSQQVLAVMKHFILNSQETNRDTVNSIVDNRTMWEVYYPPFEAAVKAGCGAAMCSYNVVNGVHACGNKQALVHDLKGSMGFEGFVQSDWWALHSFAAEDGVDQEMPGDSTPGNEKYFTDENLGTLSEEKINDMTRRQLVMIYRYRIFDKPLCQPPHCDEELYNAVATTPEHQELNKELATKAVTLLKNEGGLLPLKAKDDLKITLVGPACDAPQDVQRQLSDWMAGSYYNIGGSGRVIAGDVVTIFAGVKAKCSETDAKCTATLYSGTNVSAAVQASENADVVFICGGATSTEGGDRESLSVDDEAFLTEVAAALKTKLPVVALTMIPAQTLMPWIDNVEAALSVFLAGSYTGDAFAAAIFGCSNPSAKLPITIPKTEEDTILPCQEVECEYSEKLKVGLAAYEGKSVTFPFGHGLSYATFQYSSLHVSKGCSPGLPKVCSGSVLCVLATIKNTGLVYSGVEVAQLYLTYPESAGEPAKLLRGFVRTGDLKPHGHEEVAFPLFERDVSIYGPSGWTMANGLFEIHVGASSRDLRLSSKFGSCEGKVSPNPHHAC